MPSPRHTSLGLLLLLAVAHCDFARGEGFGILGDMREDVREPDDSPKEKKDDDDDDDDNDHRHHYHGCSCDECCDDDSDDVGLWGGLIYGTVLAPIWVPVTIAGDNYHTPREFLAHPYAAGADGYMVVGPDDDPPAWPWATRVRAEYSEYFNGLSRIGGHGLFETRWRLGADASVDYWSESSRGQTDELVTGDVNLLFRIAQSSHFLARAGAGMNWLAGDTRADFGWNVTYQTDWFPGPMWVLSAELDGGSFGNAGLFHFRTTAGYCLSCVELYAGFDYLRLGHSDLPSAVCGLRFWN
jgi:hypothetical protein